MFFCKCSVSFVLIKNSFSGKPLRKIFGRQEWTTNSFVFRKLFVNAVSFEKQKNLFRTVPVRKISRVGFHLYAKVSSILVMSNLPEMATRTNQQFNKKRLLNSLGKTIPIHHLKVWNKRLWTESLYCQYLSGKNTTCILKRLIQDNKFIHTGISLIRKSFIEENQPQTLKISRKFKENPQPRGAKNQLSKIYKGASIRGRR